MGKKEIEPSHFHEHISRRCLKNGKYVNPEAIQNRGCVPNYSYEAIQNRGCVPNYSIPNYS